MPAPADWLDRPLVVLNVGRRGFAPLTWRDTYGLAGLAFADAGLAQRHLERAARGRTSRPAVAPVTLAAGDLRAREEWLRAVLEAGAARVAFDLPDVGVPPLDTFELTGALLAEVLSQKRGLACL